LRKAGSPEKAAVIPLPFDVTTATADDPQFVVQFEQDANLPAEYLNHHDIFVTVPLGSSLVNPIQNSSGEVVTGSFNNQSWGGSTFSIGVPYILKKKYVLVVYYSGQLSEDNKRNGQSGYQLGQKIISTKSPSFSSHSISFYNHYRKQKLLYAPNFLFFGGSLFEENGHFPTLSFDESNLVKVNNQFAFILANDNPLLQLPAK